MFLRGLWTHPEFGHSPGTRQLRESPNSTVVRVDRMASADHQTSLKGDRRGLRSTTHVSLAVLSMLTRMVPEESIRVPTFAA